MHVLIHVYLNKKHKLIKALGLDNCSASCVLLMILLNVPMQHFLCFNMGDLQC